MITETYLGKLLFTKPFIYMSLSSVPFVELMIQIFNISILGFSLGTLALIFLIILFDFFTGVAAAKAQGEKLSSSKGLKTVYKLISYLLAMAALSILEDMVIKNNIPFAAYILNYFRIGLFTLAFLWEFYSIGENIERRTGSKPKIFSFLDRITRVLERKLGDSIVNKLDEKDNKENNTNNVIDNTVDNNKI